MWRMLKLGMNAELPNVQTSSSEIDESAPPITMSPNLKHVHINFVNKRRTLTMAVRSEIKVMVFTAIYLALG
jgi:hypothetical protein